MAGEMGGDDVAKRGFCACGKVILLAPAHGLGPLGVFHSSSACLVFDTRQAYLMFSSRLSALSRIRDRHDAS
jgi:hypothetical protein